MPRGRIEIGKCHCPRAQDGSWAMKLKHGLHLAYCTNIHRGENWAETYVDRSRPTRAGGAAAGLSRRTGLTRLDYA